MTSALNLENIQTSGTFSVDVPNKPSPSLVEHLRAAFLNPESPGMQSLHDRIVQLPYFKRLAAGNISAGELLLKLVNDSAIYSQFEAIIKTKETYKKLLGKNLFRHRAIENDINFFINQFKLCRPEMTSETRNYLLFIEKITQEEDKLFPVLLYVQYTRLFGGRIITVATEKWLTQNVAGWDTLPEEKRGLSYWQFKGLTLKELEGEKEKFLHAINKYGVKFNISEKAQEVAKKTFSHIISSVESCNVNSVRTIQTFQNSESIRLNPKIVFTSLVTFFVGIALAALLQSLFAKNLK